MTCLLRCEENFFREADISCRADILRIDSFPLWSSISIKLRAERNKLEDSDHSDMSACLVFIKMLSLVRCEPILFSDILRYRIEVKVIFIM